MDVTREEIMQAAWDVRLELTLQEMGELEKEVGDILAEAVFLQDSALDDVGITVLPLALENTARGDTAFPSLSQEEALANAPEVESPYMQVPKIVE